MKRMTVVAGFRCLLGGLALVALAYQARAEDALAPPPGSNLLLAARADGVQVYVCTQTDKGQVWVFDGPSASLFNDKGRQIGVHGKGPIWTLGDGSGVTGELVAKQAAPQAGAVPWLLVKVKAHVGTFGMLTNVSYVRRIDTAGGGEPEDGCDPQHQGDIARIRYSAVYQFYGQ
ncbi:MAG: DUF3455 domain-containing protein [Methylocella sp.]